MQGAEDVGKWSQLGRFPTSLRSFGVISLTPAGISNNVCTFSMRGICHHGGGEQLEMQVETKLLQLRKSTLCIVFEGYGIVAFSSSIDISSSCAQHEMIVVEYVQNPCANI